MPRSIANTSVNIKLTKQLFLSLKSVNLRFKEQNIRNASYHEKPADSHMAVLMLECMSLR
jgi:hypothetical protein